MPEKAAVAVQDLRTEDRSSAVGLVRLILDHSGKHEVEGELLDLSLSGFRATHTSTALIPGKVIRFQYVASAHQIAVSKCGWARVIWTRTLDAKMESGFFVVLSE